MVVFENVYFLTSIRNCKKCRSSLLFVSFLEDETDNWNVHGHIVRVNEANSRRGLDNIPIEEEIVAVNEGKTADLMCFAMSLGRFRLYSL